MFTVSRRERASLPLATYGVPLSCMSARKSYWSRSIDSNHQLVAAAEAGGQRIVVRFTPPRYAHYLRTELWKEIRARVFDRDNGRCVRCTSHATCVHHQSYHSAVLNGEDDTFLHSLCEPCHTLVHRYPETGSVRPAVEWDAILAPNSVVEAKGGER